MKKLFIKTYGCQMNVYDSLKMQELLEPFNFTITSDVKESDLVILNTCHIREKAAEKTYSEIGRIKKIKDQRMKDNNSRMIIVVAGCVGQAEGEEIFRRAPCVDIVVGPQSYYTLPDLVGQILRSEKHLIELDFVENEKFDKLPTNTLDQGSSAFVSIQEGCDKFCTFCVVPYTRGSEFSRGVAEIYKECLNLVRKGAKEIYLLGQNVNAYHGVAEDGQEVSLAKLIKYLTNIEGVERIRYTTSHPKDMQEDLIELHGTEEKLMPFLHLPAQSGSDKILKAMNRRYTIDEYLKIIDKLKKARKDIVLSSDFIVGFPGETDKDFEDTLNLIKEVKYGQCYSFKYSPRPGTPAAMKEQLPEDVKNSRLEILQMEICKHQLNTNRSMIGSTVPVLFEKYGKFENQILGKTPYMQSTYINQFDESMFGKILNVRITEAFLNSLTGEIIY